MDAGEAPSNRHQAIAEAGLHGRVLAAGTLAHVLVANHNPGLPCLVVGLRHVGEALPFAGELVLAHADDVLVVGANGPEIEVPRDVLEVAPILQPGPSHRNMVGGELAVGLNQDRQALIVFAIPCGERLEKLEPI